MERRTVSPTSAHRPTGERASSCQVDCDAEIQVLRAGGKGILFHSNSSPVKGTEQEVRGEFPTVSGSSPYCIVRNIPRRMNLLFVTK